MLEIQELSKAFGRTYAVDRVSFVIRPGEILGYLGPNGSGKSTTVKMLTCLLEPTSGHILYDGRDIRQDPVAFKSLLGYVPEEPHLYPYLTGREYLQSATTKRRSALRWPRRPTWVLATTTQWPRGWSSASGRKSTSG